MDAMEWRFEEEDVSMSSNGRLQRKQAKQAAKQKQSEHLSRARTIEPADQFNTTHHINQNRTKRKCNATSIEWV